MATKLELTPTERAARRAEQSRLCRAKKTGDTTQTSSATAPKGKKQPQAKTTALNVAQLLVDAGADLKAFRPKGIIADKQSLAGFVIDEESAVLQINNVENLNVKAFSNDFKQWAEGKEWRQKLRLSVLEINEPGKKLPAVQFYVVADEVE